MPKDKPSHQDKRSTPKPKPTSGDKDAATALFKNVTRYSTPEERETVERIDLNPAELDRFMGMLRQGLIEAVSVHEAAVQNNMALRVETSVRLSRPVYNATTDRVEELVGEVKVQGELSATKVRRTGATGKTSAKKK